MQAEKQIAEVFSFRCTPKVIGDLDALARREGKARSKVLRELINDALVRARSGEPILKAS